MKKIILIQLISITSTILHAQNINFSWAKQMGGIGIDRISSYSIAVDANGYVYTTGAFSGTTDFDPGPGTFNLTSPGWCPFISKLDSAGNFIWARMMVGTHDVKDYGEGHSIALDAAGNVYATGAFGGNIDFDPGPGTFILSTKNYPDPVGAYWFMDCFVSKLDTAGNFVWAKRMGGDWQTLGNSINYDASGNLYIFGGLYGTTDFDPGPAIFNLTDWGVFVSKLDAAGNLIWAKSTKATKFPGQDKDGRLDGNSMALDAAGNIYCTGRFYGEADFDPGGGVVALTADQWDIYVWKLNNDGNFVWVKQLGGVGDENVMSIAVDNSGNVLTTGWFGETVDFDPGPGVFDMVGTAIYNIFISKLDASGNFVFAKQLVGTGSVVGESISVDVFGNIYTMGYFHLTVDFDPGPGTYNFSADLGDMFLSKLDLNGDFIWAKQIDGDNASFTAGHCMVLDAYGNIYSTGSFNGTADFDPGPGVYQLTPPGQEDIFIHKMRQCLNSLPVSLTVAECKNYTLNGQTYTSSGVYTQTLINKGGCDSVITLNLTINRLVSQASVSACGSYYWNGQTFNISGTYTDTLIAANGCDSVCTLNLVVNSTASSTINASICQGQSYAGYTIAGNYIDTLIATNGCDSVRSINLVVKPTASSTINASICPGQSFADYTTSGTYVDTLLTTNGCDSVRTIHLVVSTYSSSILTQSICQGQTYLGYGTSGTYIDTLPGTAGCDSVRTLYLSVYPTYNVVIDTTICNGQSFEGHNSTGTYINKLASINGCDSVRTIKLTVLPPVSPGLGKDTTICTGNTITLYPGQFTSYLWQDGSTNSRFTVQQPGLYSVTVSDNCGSAKDEIGIAGGICEIYVPSAFTPNNDGKNDLFRVPYANNVNDFRLVVYSRWGQKVFETNNPSKGWNGEVNGKPQNTGAFAWHCEFRKHGNAELVIMNGTVMLIR